MISNPTERLELPAAKQKLAEYLADPGRFSEPYPIFDAVRAAEPVHWSDAGLWIVLGHPEGREAFLHPALSRAEVVQKLVDAFGDLGPTARDALAVWASHPNNTDEPQHKRLRMLMQHAFSPRAIRKWEATIVNGVNELVRGLRSHEEFDLLHEYAYRLPSIVIADIIGVPREDHKLFEKWTADWFNAINFTDQRAKPDSAAVKPLEEFVAYIRQVIRERRQRPSADAEDLTGFLVNAEEQGDRLNEIELIAAIMIIIIGGHETTANLIGNGSLSLMRNPAQMAALKANPALINPTVEECLRFESPARSQPRLVEEDVTIGGQQIRSGQLVQVHVGAANRDPRVFERANEMDITRNPNRHIGFGYGMHACIGLHIARLEARYAIAALVNEMGALKVARPVEWRSAHVRGLVSLPVQRI